jgi:hypothetical protein
VENEKVLEVQVTLDQVLQLLPSSSKVVVKVGKNALYGGSPAKLVDAILKDVLAEEVIRVEAVEHNSFNIFI